MGVKMCGYCPICERHCSWPVGQGHCNMCQSRIAKGEPPLGFVTLTIKIFWRLAFMAGWVYIFGGLVYAFVRDIM